MIRENEIKEAVRKYLAGASLDDFKQWLAGQSWNMHRDSEATVQRLVGKIQMLIAEYGYGNMSEAVLRRKLHSLTSDNVISISLVNRDSEPSFTSNSTVQIPPFGIQVSEVSVS